MANIRFESDEGNYKTVAYGFFVTEDLYLYFKFDSPKSHCEISISYDEFSDGGDWNVCDGELGGCDWEIIDDIIWNRLYTAEEFRRFDAAVQRAVQVFNGQ